MGAKTSKSANISGTPKKETVAVEGENHVNGVAADTKLEVKDSNNTNHVAEVIAHANFYTLLISEPSSSLLLNRNFPY
jgi:hypothetical protein